MLKMPTPITHVVLAERIYEKYFRDEDKQEFYVGICFPDIRRVAHIKRSKTHSQNFSMSDLQNDSSFLNRHSYFERVGINIG